MITISLKWMFLALCHYDNIINALPVLARMFQKFGIGQVFRGVIAAAVKAKGSVTVAVAVNSSVHLTFSGRIYFHRCTAWIQWIDKLGVSQEASMIRRIDAWSRSRCLFELMEIWQSTITL
jgi:hypothetical protein